MNSVPEAVNLGQRRVRIEILVVLAVSFGQSAIYAILRIIERMTRAQALSQQTSTLNNSAVPERPWLDLAYQLAQIGFGLAPVGLVMYLLWLSNRRPFELIGFDLKRPGRDFATGFGLLAVIGIPGLGFYLLAREIGINTTVVAANLAENWWTIPVLIALAAMNGISEEVVMVGWLFSRLAELKWAPVAILVSSALIRGSYHLYQGWGGFIGNIVMGLVLGLAYLRWKRVMPLVIFHTLIDVCAFVGYALVTPYISWL